MVERTPPKMYGYHLRWAVADALDTQSGVEAQPIAYDGGGLLTGMSDG